MDEELFITYGDKSNEELLFLYGEARHPLYQAKRHTVQYAALGARPLIRPGI